MVEEDDLYEPAVKFVQGCAGPVGFSALQRRFVIGFNRASRLFEAMKTRGVVRCLGNGKFEQINKEAP